MIGVFAFMSGTNLAMSARIAHDKPDTPTKAGNGGADPPAQVSETPLPAVSVPPVTRQVDAFVASVAAARVPLVPPLGCGLSFPAMINTAARRRQELRHLLLACFGAEEERRVMALVNAGKVRGDPYERLAAGDTLDADGNWVVRREPDLQALKAALDGALEDS